MFDLTVTSLMGYGVMLWLAIQSLGQRFALRELAGSIAKAHKAFSRNKNNPAICRKLRSLHPGAAVSAALKDGGNVQDDLSIGIWIKKSLDTTVEPIKREMERIRDYAPLWGLAGTMVGFLLAVSQYAVNQDRTRMLSSVALAMGTTLVGTLVSWHQTKLLFDLAELRSRMAGWGLEVLVEQRTLTHIKKQEKEDMERNDDLKASDEAFHFDIYSAEEVL